jgi:hypothetical protein
MTVNSSKEKNYTGACVLKLSVTFGENAFSPCDESGGFHFECLGDTPDRVQGRSLRSALDVAEEPPVDASVQGGRFLAQIELQPRLADGLTESLCGGHRHAGRFVGLGL